MNKSKDLLYFRVDDNFLNYRKSIAYDLNNKKITSYKPSFTFMLQLINIAYDCDYVGKIYSVEQGWFFDKIREAEVTGELLSLMKITKETIAGVVPVTETELRYMAKNHKGYDLTKLDTSNITNMCSLFLHSVTFNQDIGNWNTSNVTAMDIMFQKRRLF